MASGLPSSLPSPPSKGQVISAEFLAAVVEAIRARGLLRVAPPLELRAIDGGMLLALMGGGEVFVVNLVKSSGANPDFPANVRYNATCREFSLADVLPVLGRPAYGTAARIVPQQDNTPGIVIRRPDAAGNAQAYLMVLGESPHFRQCPSGA